METEVVMLRDLFGSPVSQKSKTGYLSATDLFRAGNKWRSENGIELFNMNSWFQNKSTVEFMEELQKECDIPIKINSRGKGQHTWVHPFLFLDMALAISPKLKVETYRWLHDELLKFRNQSGDSFKKFSGAVYLKLGDKSEMKKSITNYSLMIRNSVGVEDWNKATKEQLELRDKIHEAVSLYSDVMTDISQIVRLAIKRYIPSAAV
jgi:hypothetical protein